MPTSTKKVHNWEHSRISLSLEIATVTEHTLQMERTRQLWSVEVDGTVARLQIHMQVLNWKYRKLSPSQFLRRDEIGGRVGKKPHDWSIERSWNLNRVEIKKAEKKKNYTFIIIVQIQFYCWMLSPPGPIDWRQLTCVYNWANFNGYHRWSPLSPVAPRHQHHLYRFATFNLLHVSIYR